MNSWRARLRSLFRKREDLALDEELRFHLEAQAAEFVRQGMNRAGAERAARIAIGGMQQVKEECREARMLSRIEGLGQDLRFGLRLLAKEKGFTAVAVLTLAVGIGVNLAAFNVLNAMLYRPLAVRDPDSLVRAMRQAPSNSSTNVAYPAIEFVAKNNSVFSAVMSQISAEYPLGEDLQQRASVEFVSPNYFGELGVGAAYGRVFDAKSGHATAEPVAVLSYRYWERQYGSDTRAIGKTIRVNLKTATIIGVAPFDFSGLGGTNGDLWLSIEQHAYFAPGSSIQNDPLGGTDMYARLKPGVSQEAAEDALAPLSEEVRKNFPRAMHEGQRLVLSRAGYMSGSNRRLEGPELALISAVGTLFLLILTTACANLGNLLLARAVTREREISIRKWVGASRGRIVFQLLTESMLLAMAGAAAAAGFAAAALRMMRVTMNMPAHFELYVDYRVVLFAAGIAMLACALFGLTPALEAARQGHRKHWARRVMIGLQVAASCVLLIVSGLLVRSLDKALYSDLGFEYKNVLAVDPPLAGRGMQPAAVMAYVEELRARLGAMPGVTHVALTTIPPLGNRSFTTSVPGMPSMPLYVSDVDAQYFSTMAIPILHGRNFLPGDKDVAIISESLARAAWPGEDPLGKKAPTGGIVIGVAGSARTVALRDGTAAELYRPFAINVELGLEPILLVKAAGPPESVADNARRIALSVNADVVPAITLLKESFARRIQDSRNMAAVVISMGVMAAALSAIGVFGLVAYAVSQRQKEIGVRMALGAMPAHVLGLVMRQFARPVVAGLVAGICLAAGLSMALRRELYGLSHLDPASYALAILLFLAITGAAALIPARRALRVDPAVVLRHE